MRKLPVLITCTVMIVVLTIPAYAHPGKTDSSGGHWDHSVAEYHYHHGYSAHSHYDVDGDGIIDCPYDFDDQTDYGSSSNSSDSSSDSYRYTYPDTPVNTTIPLKKAEVESVESTLSSKNKEKKFNMFTQFLEALPMFLAHLIPAAPFCLILGVILMLITYWTISLLLFKVKDEDKRHNYSFAGSVIITISLMTYWFLPDLVDYLSESKGNIISFMVLVLLSVAKLIYIIHSTNKDRDEILKGKDAVLDELRKKNSEYCTIVKDLSNLCEDLQEKLNQTERRHQSASDYILRLQRETQQAKYDSTAAANKNNVLLQEIGELKQKLFFYEKGHTVLKPQIDNLPSDVYFVDGLPIAGKVTEHEPFGRFTVYTSKKGTRFHSDDICGGNWLHPIHLFEAIESKQRCMKCGGSLPNSLPDWYITFKRTK